MTKQATGTYLAALIVLMLVFVAGCATISPVDSGSASPSSGSPEASASASLEVTTSPTEIPMTIAPTETPGALATPTSTPSPTPTPTLPATPTPVPTPKPANIKSFSASETTVDCNVLPEPFQVHLEWSIARATGVTISIDGPGIYDSYPGATGSADVPFACGDAKHTYTLTTTGGDGAAASQTITVKRAKPAFDEADTYVPGITSTVLCLSPITRSLHWHVLYASGVKIETGGVLLGTYNGAEGSTMVTFDCTASNTQTYKLTTIATYGPQATLEVETFYNYQP